MRTILRKLHLYIGAFLGIVFVLSGISGSVLVYRVSLDKFLNPELRTVTPRDAPVDLEAALQSAKKSYPERTIRHVRLPWETDEALELRTKAGDRYLYANPYSGEILGSRHPDSGFIGLLYAFHTELLFGPIGRTVLGVLGLIYIVLLITGICLWWPGFTHLKRGLTIKGSTNWKGIIYELHKTIGFYGFLLLILSVLTGVGLCFYVTTRTALESTFGGRPPSPPKVERIETGPESAGNAGTWPILDHCLHRAKQLKPNGKRTWVHLPGNTEQPLAIRYYTPSEFHPHGNGYLYFHPRTGEIIKNDPVADNPTGTDLWHFIYPLHAGFFWGWIGRVLMILLGLVPAALFGTGLMIWWNRNS